MNSRYFPYLFTRAAVLFMVSCLYRKSHTIMCTVYVIATASFAQLWNPTSHECHCYDPPNLPTREHDAVRYLLTQS